MTLEEGEERRVQSILRCAGTTGAAGHRFRSQVVVAISEALTAILADIFALYVKTKNFHWHMSGPHFRDYHLLLDEQSEQMRLVGDLRVAHSLCNGHRDIASASLIENWIDEGWATCLV